MPVQPNDPDLRKAAGKILDQKVPVYKVITCDECDRIGNVKTTDGVPVQSRFHCYVTPCTNQCARCHIKKVKCDVLSQDNQGEPVSDAHRQRLRLHPMAAGAPLEPSRSQPTTTILKLPSTARVVAEQQSSGPQPDSASPRVPTEPMGFTADSNQSKVPHAGTNKRAFIEEQDDDDDDEVPNPKKARKDAMSNLPVVDPPPPVLLSGREAVPPAVKKAGTEATIDPDELVARADAVVREGETTVLDSDVRLWITRHLQKSNMNLATIVDALREQYLEQKFLVRYFRAGDKEDYDEILKQNP